MSGFLPCSAPQFLNAWWTLGKVKNQSHHTNSYFSPPNSEKCILLLEEYKEEIPTLFEAWECFVEKTQFSFPLQFVCMRQTVGVWVSGLKTSCIILTSNRSFTSLQLSTCWAPSSCWALHSTHWGILRVNEDPSLAAGGGKYLRTGLGWPKAAQKTAETCTGHNVHLISLHGFSGFSSDVTVNFCNHAERRLVPPTRSGVTAPCVTLIFWQKIPSVSLQ